MLTKRVIACLDVGDGEVVQGVGFRAHREVGEVSRLRPSVMSAREYVVCACASILGLARRLRRGSSAFGGGSNQP